MQLQSPDFKNYQLFLNKLKNGRFLKSSAFSAANGHRYLIPLALLGCSLILAFLVCSFLQGTLISRTAAVQIELAQIVGQRQASAFAPRQNQKNGTFDFRAFDVAAQNPSEKTQEAAPTPIDAFQLIGTLSNIGAWINVEKETTLVLRQQAFKGYVLELVDSGRVLFSKDGDNFPVYLNYSGETAAGNKPASTPTVVLDDRARQIVPAAFNGNDGTITRELLNDLLANPYAEIAKIRLVPDAGGQGMTIMSMNDTSLLRRLGLQQNDILTGINSVSINDMPNLVNAINSMLTGARLDFQVLRGGAPGKLGYVVR